MRIDLHIGSNILPTTIDIIGNILYNINHTKCLNENEVKIVLYFKDNVHFVKGYKNAAIYDNNKDKVYAINDYGKEIIEKMLLGKVIESEIEQEYIDNLKKMEILTDKNNYAKQDFKIPKVKLIYAWLEITEACNLKCIHCYGQFGYPKIDKKEILTTQEWKGIIDRLINFGCRNIQLIGGEPMVHKDFYEILEYAHKQGMKKIDVFTNATLIDEKSIKIFKKTNANVRVSVYGHNAKVHETITKQKGSFENNKKGLELLKRNNVPTTIAVVLMKENEKYIDEIRKYIINLGHKYNGYDVIRPSCITEKKDHSITNVELLNSRYNTKPEFWTSKKAFLNNYFYNSCWNGKIAITSNGDVIPCIFARDEIIGNIKTETKKQLEEKVIQKWKMTKDCVEICRDCEFRYCCHDCRPLARAINGKINSKYPRCCYDPYKGIWENVKQCTKEIVE